MCLIKNAKKILNQDALKEEVTLHACRRLVENVEIFQDLPKNILTQIVTNLKPELYLAKDMIIRAGTQGDCMFFLSSGTVSVLTPTGKEVSCIYAILFKTWLIPDYFNGFRDGGRLIYFKLCTFFMHVEIKIFLNFYAKIFIRKKVINF